MTDSRRLICCRDRTKRMVSEYFDQALRRSRDQLLPIHGELVKGNSRLIAQFYLDVHGNHVKTASYKCTTCVALVVYCERLAEMAVGLSLEETMTIDPPDLTEAFPEVPAYKHDRADFALQALRSAVSAATLAATLNVPSNVQSREDPK